MSFEGWYQVLCANGHDMGGHDPYGRKWTTCKHCGAEAGWTNLVDVTNGSFCTEIIYDEDGDWEDEIQCTGCEHCDKGRIDGYVELKVRVPAVFCECSCGHRHIVEPPKYHIPG